MTSSIHVLIVEDSEADAELLLRELRRIGRPIEHRRVEDAESMKGALAEGAWDLILSDWSMPRFSAIDALATLRATGLDIPFIIVSGTAGEESAVEALRAGAHDFVAKGRLARLLPAVNRELVDRSVRVSRRRAEQELGASEIRYRALFDYAPDGIVIADRESRYLDANASACRMLGYPREELVGLGAADIVVPAEVRHVGPALDSIKSGSDYHREWQFRRKDGSVFPADVIATQMPDGNLLGMLRDVSERKRIEQAFRDNEALRHAADHRLAEIMQQMTEACFALDTEWRFTFVNDRSETLLRRRREEMLGRSIWDVFPLLVGTPKEVQYRRAMELRVPVTAEMFSSVAERWIEIRLFPTDEGIAAFLLDVHERRLSEDALRANEARYRGTLDSMMEGCQIIGRDWRYLYVNEAAVRHGRKPAEELLGRTMMECYPGIEVTPVFAVIKRCMDGMHREQVDNTFVYPDGSSASFQLGVQSVPEGVFVLSLDVSARVKAEEGLRLFRMLVDQSNDVFEVIEPETGRFLDVSDKGCSSLGYSRAEHLALRVSDIDPAIAQSGWPRVVEEIRSVGIRNGTGVHRRKDGSTFPIEFSAKWVHLDRDYIVAVVRDITDREWSERYTAVQHEATEVLSEGAALPETILRILEIVCRRLEWDLGDLWTYDRASRTLRCAEIWHPPSTEFRSFADESRRLALAAGDGLPGRVWHSKEPMWIPDVTRSEFFRRGKQANELGLRGGIGFPIKLPNEVFGVIEFFSTKSRPPDADMLAMFSSLGTQIGQFIERKQIDDQYRQAQKMESIGTLAGGIAHDFNNILGAIIGYTELARGRVEGDPTTSKYLDAVLQGGARAGALVRQILAFSRRQVTRLEPAQLRKLVAEPLALLRATLPTSIQFDLALDADVPSILADATQIHQVVMNICTNAGAAMADRPGRLGVRIERVLVDEFLAATTPGLEPGVHVRLSISDTGHGMDRATQARAFEPFFTTKPQGEGTGLGLSVVHGIVKGHGGAITLYSQPGEGTTFHVYFPAVGSEPESSLASESVPRGHGERILFVDDETALATLGETMLRSLGYEARSVTNAMDAIALVRANPSAFDLVITDLTMPEMLGTQVAKQLLLIRPNLPIILMTGYMADLTTERIKALGVCELSLKPHTLRSLGAVVHRVLAAQTTR